MCREEVALDKTASLRRRFLRKWSQALHNGAWQEDKGQQAYAERREVHMEYKEKLFHPEDSQEVEQAGQGVGVICMLCGFQDPTV